MKTTLMTAAAVTLAASASAQTIDFTWQADRGSVGAGDVVTLSLWAEWDPANVGIASTIYEIFGDDDAFAASLTINVTEGAADTPANFLGRNPNFRFSGTFPPVVNGDDITAPPSGVDCFQLPIQFNPNFDASNPVELFRFTWSTSDGTPRTVTYNSVHDNADVYIDNFGSTIPYTISVFPVSFRVVPAPGAAVLLGLGALVAVRRRR